jgi:hypothetical protein
VRNLRLSLMLFFLLLTLTACGDDPNAPAPFAGLDIAPDYSHVSAPDGRSWDVAFEYSDDSYFSGIVRHVSTWDEASIPFMTHDILVTTGEFASRGTVDTLVINHKFFFHYKNGPPKGTINLLHIFPASEEIYRQLLKIKDWDQVTISGREIYRIDINDAQGKNKGGFMDHGCNSILVTSVIVKAQGTPVP